MTLYDPAYLGTYCILAVLLVLSVFYPKEAWALVFMLELRIKLFFTKIKLAWLTFQLIRRIRQDFTENAPDLTWKNIWPRDKEDS
tara:strand:- start:14 stop:268 length:255 start_codon:yes stop_codon:yes gene_type:complete